MAHLLWLKFIRIKSRVGMQLVATCRQTWGAGDVRNVLVDENITDYQNQRLMRDLETPDQIKPPLMLHTNQKHSMRPRNPSCHLHIDHCCMVGGVNVVLQPPFK